MLAVCVVFNIQPAALQRINQHGLGPARGRLVSHTEHCGVERVALRLVVVAVLLQALTDTFGLADV